MVNNRVATVDTLLAFYVDRVIACECQRSVCTSWVTAVASSAVRNQGNCLASGILSRIH